MKKVGAHTTIEDMIGMIDAGVERAEGVVFLTNEHGVRYTIEKVSLRQLQDERDARISWIGTWHDANGLGN